MAKHLGRFYSFYFRHRREVAKSLHEIFDVRFHIGTRNFGIGIRRKGKP